MKSISNIEFHVSPGTRDTIYACQDGIHIPFEEIPDNLINIIFCRLLDYGKMMSRAYGSHDDKRTIVKKFILRYWSKYDAVPDIDDNENFNFENVQFNDVRDLLIETYNHQITELETQERIIQMRKGSLLKDLAIVTNMED